MRLQERCFNALQRRMLIYNACCEDPALDCEALNLNGSDRVLVITSGGCNALAYLLAGAGQVDAVDLNPCQNALLEFKAAAIRGLDFADVWELFGCGRSRRVRAMYGDAIRRQLTEPARRFWDSRLHLFHGSRLRPSFYHHGGWGLVMRIIQASWQVRDLRRAIEGLFATSSLAEQWEHYTAHLRSHLWQRWFCWLASRPLAHAMLGIPPRQRRAIMSYPGGLYGYGQALLDDLVARVPFASNYFMRANALGEYSRDCCPEYLTPEGFYALKGGLLERLNIHTASVTEYLEACPSGIAKFVLLDHMDWLESDALRREWRAILSRAAPGATILFRSALQEVDYLDGLTLEHQGRVVRLGDLLTYDRELAAALHQRDRVHLYGSFSIARLC
jgi:S-adenosylmethionine-diacylglycerol 3-amino-3-carboxypropyl transferase